MSFSDLLRQPGAVLSPASTTDRYHNSTTDWADPDEAPYPACLQQTATVEVTVGRDAVLSDWLLFLPAEAVITSYDRWRDDETGRVFEVVGLPNLVHTPRGTHHIEVRLAASSEG